MAIDVRFFILPEARTTEPPHDLARLFGFAVEPQERGDLLHGGLLLPAENNGIHGGTE